jgi:hypothetical protein
MQLAGLLLTPHESGVQERGMNLYRDPGPYSGRNSSKGALIPEIERVVAALNAGLPLDDIRQRALDGDIFIQRARSTRQRIWWAIHHLYLTQPEWGLADLGSAYSLGPQSREFVSLLYLHYALQDCLTFDFVTQVLWPRWQVRKLAVTSEDLREFIDRAKENQPQISEWAESTRISLAIHILAALRDFGVLEGQQKKTLAQPVLPLFTARHLLRILIEEGHRGADVLCDPTWRLFFLTENDVAHILSRLAQERVIRFERVGDTVVLQTPEDWRPCDA